MNRNSAKENVGIRDVAHRAGVSVATISRALNTPDKVAQRTRERVLEAVRELNYIPDSAARALSLRRTHIIGAVIPTIDNSIFARFIQALQRRVAAEGYTLIIASYDFDLDIEWAQLQSLVANGAEAVVLSGENHRPGLYSLLTSKGIPYVNTSIYNPESRHPCVGYDNYGAAKEACEYLLDQGHRRIAVIANILAQNDRAAARVAGIRAALAERGLSLPDDHLVERPFTIADGREALHHLMALEPRPTAVLCGNDVQGFGALLAAQSLDISVPRDLSIVGFDDLDWASEVEPSLTTVNVPTDTMGEAAGAYLLALLRGETPPSATRIPVELLVRGSTGPAPAG